MPEELIEVKPTLSNKEIAKRAFTASIPILVSYVVLGIGFGIMMESHGFGPIWVLLMCITVYSGTGQYVGVDLLASCASLLTTGLTTFMISIRYLFYSVTMLRQYSNVKGIKKMILIWTVTDETYALLCNIQENDDFPTQADKQRYSLMLTLMNQSYWITGSLLGNLLGAALDYDFTGIDFVMTALFMAVLVQQWLDSDNHIIAITGVVVSLACLIIFGQSQFLIPTMLIIVIALSIERRLGLVGEDLQVGGGESLQVGGGESLQDVGDASGADDVGGAGGGESLQDFGETSQSDVQGGGKDE